MLGHKLFLLCLFFWHQRSVFSTTADLKPLYFCVKPRSDASRSAWDLIFSSFADQQLQAQSKPSGKLLLLFIQGSFIRAHPLLSQQCPFFSFFAYTQTPTHTHTLKTVRSPVQPQSSTAVALQQVPSSGTP